MRFKVGDIVRITSRDKTDWGEFRGKDLVITKIVSRNTYPIKCTIKDSSRFTWFYEKELALYKRRNA